MIRLRRFTLLHAAAVVFAVVFWCGAAGATADEGTTYGEGVTLKESVKVADLLAKPDAYVGKTVRVDGIIVAVCQNMGCWMEIADDERSKGIQFKVDDGVIEFPKDGKGRRASAQGTFEALPAEPEGEYAAAKAPDHAAHASHAAPAGAPKYRVKATGAIVY